MFATSKSETIKWKSGANHRNETFVVDLDNNITSENNLISYYDAGVTLHENKHYSNITKARIFTWFI